jgi:hypothetical protein
MSESDCKKMLIVLVIVAIACLMLDAFSRAPCVCEGAPSVEQHLGHFPGMPDTHPRTDDDVRGTLKRFRKYFGAGAEVPAREMRVHAYQCVLGMRRAVLFTHKTQPRHVPGNLSQSAWSKGH